MTEELKKKPLFNPDGDTEVRLRRMIGGNTTNLNDFNNICGMLSTAKQEGNKEELI